MAYEPLHLKYRPQRFADVVGQAAVVTALSNAIRKGRIAPAYLFCGPRGTGKTSSARILAKSLNCIDGPTPDPCGVCEQCRAITRGSSLDVIEIDAASNTGVDNIRELIERVQFAPVSSRYKVYVIDECHMLSTSAFNALLKTLEEPPDRVVFVLATTDPQRVLPTVISRCQRFDYRRIPLEDMVAHLAHIAQAEGIPATPETLQLIAQISQGGLRDAEALLDQLSLLDGTIEVEAVWDLVGSVPERQLLTLTDAIASRDPEQVLGQARALMDAGKEPLLLLQNLASFYRDLTLAKTAPQRRDLVALTQPTWEAMRERADLYSTDHLLHLQSHLRQAEPQLRQSGQPRLWLEITLMGLLEDPAPASARPSAPASLKVIPFPSPKVTPVNSGISHSGIPKSDAAPDPVKVPPPLPHPIQAQPPDPGSTQSTRSTETRLSETRLSETRLSETRLSETPIPASQRSLTQNWAEFLNRLSPVASARLRMGKILQETDQKVVIGFPSAGFVSKVKSSHGEVQQAIEALLQQTIEVHFEVIKPGSSPPALSPPPVSLAPTDGPPPSPRPAPTPDPDPPRSEHGSLDPVNPASTPTQPAASPLEHSLGSDDLDQAVRRFADFFNGTVINVEDPEDPNAPAPAPLSPDPISALATDAPDPRPIQNGSEPSPVIAASLSDPAPSAINRSGVNRSDTSSEEAEWDPDDIPF